MTSPLAPILNAAQVGIPILLTAKKRGIFEITNPDGTIDEMVTSKGISPREIIALVTISEEHVDELEITEHPVEQGAPITDHAYKKPAQLTLTLGWSNSEKPSQTDELIRLAEVYASMFSSVAGQIVSIAEMITGGLNLLNKKDVIKAAYETLLLLQSNRQIFTVYTAKRTYYNMMCVGLSTKTDYETADALIITVKCREVLLVNTQIIQNNGEIQDKGTKQATLTSYPLEPESSFSGLASYPLESSSSFSGTTF